LPGTRLNSIEQKLLSSWERGRVGPYPALKSIDIDAPSGRGLRGIRKIHVDFGFPVTFLSGQNGSGKSTLLSLAALAFHGIPGHSPATAKRYTGAGTLRFGYYTFQDFFHIGPGDTPVSDVRIQWSFAGAPDVTVTKQTDKWMRYERRPKRPVEFLGLSRAVPAIELPSLRNQFGFAAKATATPLSDEARLRLGQILGRPYPSAEVLNGSRHAIRRSAREGGYTSFNMGTGEDALIGLLAKLEAVPEGALVVIEELETGLHPAAQQKATRALVEIAAARKLQVIGSTHSHHVLDQLPRLARLLLIREGDSHRSISAPSTQLALSEISEASECELLVLCEDEFAAALIRRMLSKALRRRVSVRSCGPKNELAQQAQSHLRLAERARCLILWDGDVLTSECERYISQAQVRYPLPSSSTRLSWAQLPGGTCPELWALEVARSSGLDEAKRQFNFDSNAEARATLALCGLGDPHAVGYELAQHTGMSQDEAAKCLVACAALSAESEQRRLQGLIQAVLDGQQCQGSVSAETAPV
jgi:hypothetical protein